jgi:hypothetical protein
MIPSAEDYESFLEIMGKNLPYTYDVWLKFSPQWHDEHTKNGDQTRDIHVDPDEFSRFLSKTGRAPDLNALSMFAQSILDGETY